MYTFGTPETETTMTPDQTIMTDMPDDTTTLTLANGAEITFQTEQPEAPRGFDPDAACMCINCADVEIPGFAAIPMPIQDGLPSAAIGLALIRTYYLKHEGITATLSPAFIAAHLAADASVNDAFDVLKHQGIPLQGSVSSDPTQIQPDTLHPAIIKEAGAFRVRDWQRFDTDCDIAQLLAAGNPLMTTALINGATEAVVIYKIALDCTVTARTATDTTITFPLDALTNVWTILL